jgi:hypothetical protein
MSPGEDAGAELILENDRELAARSPGDIGGRSNNAVVFKDQLGSRVLSVLHFHPRGRTGVAGGPETE